MSKEIMEENNSLIKLESSLQNIAQEWIDVSNAASIISDLDDSYKDIVSSFFDFGKKLNALKDAYDKNNVVLGGAEYFSFIEMRYGVGKSTVYNLINVYLAFKDKYDQLDERFKSFSFSSLVELLPLKDDKEFASQLSCLSTRDLNKTLKEIKRAKDYQRPVIQSIYQIVKSLCSKKDIKFEICSSEEIKQLHVREFDGYMYKFFKLNGVPYYIQAYKSVSSSHIVSIQIADNNKYYWHLQYIALNSINKDIEQFFYDFERKYKEYKKEQEKRVDTPKVSKSKVITGIAAKLGLKRNMIVDYVDDLSNYQQLIYKNEQIGIKIFSLKDVPGIYLLRHPKTFYSDYHIVGIDFMPLNSKQEKIDHLLKTEDEINALIKGNNASYVQEDELDSDESSSIPEEQ